MKSIPIAALLISLFTGCVQMKPIQHISFKDSAPAKRMPLNVALILDEKLKTTKLKFQGNKGDELGVSFQTYAQDTAGVVFEKVSVYSTPAEAVSKADVILIPHVIQSTYDQKTAGVLNQKVIGCIVFIVEWTARDKENKGIVWLDTVEANGCKTMIGDGFGLDLLKRLEDLHQEVFNTLGQNSAKTLQQAPEILRLTK